MLAYFRGASIVLFGSVYYRQLAYDLLGLFASRVFPLLLLVALIGGGLGIANEKKLGFRFALSAACLLYTSPSPRDLSTSRMPSSA